MPISRRAVVIAGAALLAVLGAIAVALLTLDLNQFVGPVLARLKAVTGREVTVGGDVGLEEEASPVTKKEGCGGHPGPPGAHRDCDAGRRRRCA